MQKSKNSRLYAIVDASCKETVSELKAVLNTYSPKYRDGHTLTIGGVEEVLFIEFRKREGPIFDILKTQAAQWSLYPFYVVEEDKSYSPKNDKYVNSCEYFIVEAAIFDFKLEEESFEVLQEKLRAKAKELYRNNSVFLKFHAYFRKEDKTVHLLCGNTENTNRHASGEVVLGEEGWKAAVNKLAEDMNLPVTFKKIRYKNL